MKTEEQCYAALGLSSGASDEDAKSAYREMAKKFHPDVNSDPAAKEKFLDIQQAYDCIVSKKFANGPSNNDFDFGGFQGFGGFAFPFGSFEQKINADRTFNLTITFLEACLGTTKTIAYTQQIRCHVCEEYTKNNGRQEMEGCSVCGGSGSMQRSAPGIKVVQPCSNCSGKGVILKCTTCKGVGTIANKKQVSFKIQSGIGDEALLRLDGQGNFNKNSNTYGDVYIRIGVSPHQTMTRNGVDIFSKCRVSYLDCILGADVSFETIYGMDSITIPPLTVSGAVIKRSNVGVDKIGTHILTIEVELPNSISPAEKKLLNKIRNSKLEN